MREIDISLLLHGEIVDLRIPTHIEVSRLVRELQQIFPTIEILEKYQIRVANKGLLLDEGKILSEYPVTNGDIIEIMGVDR